MGAPKIKIYQLPNGYSEAGDNDIQQATNDELLPVRDKPLAPEDFYPLYGIKTKEQESLIPVNIDSGLIQSSLVPNSAEFQAPQTGHTDILTECNDSLIPIVIDSALNIIEPSGYTLSASGVYFNSTPPSGAIIKYYRTASEPCSCFAGTENDWYNRGNLMFAPIVFDFDNATIDSSSYSVSYASGYIILDTPASGVNATYTYETNTTNFYIGDRENWIHGHLYMNVDVFKGMHDYAGDNSEDAQGNPIVQGEIPKFAEPSTYQINFRKGMVTFSEEFDSSQEPVYASFACLVGVRNVTEQQLDQISADPSGAGYCYKAVSDKGFPLSIGSRWVNRNDNYTPINFYVNEELKPQLITITPFDTLTVKNDPNT